MDYLKLREMDFRYSYFKNKDVTKVAYSPHSSIWFLFDSLDRVIDYYPRLRFYAEEPITALKGKFVVYRLDVQQALEDIAEDMYVKTT